VSTACQDLAPLVAALPLGILDEGERASAIAHMAVCSACPTLGADVEAALALTVPAVTSRALDAERTWLALSPRLERTRPKEEETRDLASQISLNCSYCHDALTRGETAFCAGCLAPHHEDCFSVHGRCSAPGCDERQIVRPGSARPPASRFRGSSRTRSALTTGLIGGFATVAMVGVASTAYLATSARPSLPPTPTALAPPPVPVAPVVRSAPVESPKREFDTQERFERSPKPIDRGIDPQVAAQRLLEEGVALMAKREFELALRVFDMALARDPYLAVAYAHRGVALRELGQLQAALISFGKAITVKPRVASVYEQRADVRLSLGDVKGAVEDLRRAVELNPRKARAWSRLGSAELAVGNVRQALADFTRCIELDPDFLAAYTQRGLCYESLADQAADTPDRQRDLFERAHVDYDFAIDLDPSSPDAWYRSGMLRHKRGGETLANQDLAKYLELSRKGGVAAVDSGAATPESSRRAAVRALLEAAKTKEADDDDAFRSLMDRD
jgi:tetratricopeptide (TPR) repeat protein